MDGGVPQLTANKDPTSLDEKVHPLRRVVYLAYCCFKDPVILELVTNTTSGSTTATDLVDDDTAASVAELPIESRHTIVDAMTLSAPRQLLVHSISNTMFLEAKECLLGCAVEQNIFEMTMVCCMFEFLYYLMLDARAIPGFAPFKPFIIGQSINLQLQQR